MTVRLQRLATTLSVLAIMVSCAVAEPATKPATKSSRVLEVRITGNRTMSDEAVLAHIRTRAGHNFSVKQIRDDRQRLLSSGKFGAVVATIQPGDEGVVVTFAVSERALVTRIELRGNRELSDEVLAVELTFSAGDPLDVFAVEAGRQAILAKYRDEGYFFVRVTRDGEALAKRNQVVYRIVEGPRVRVRDIEFEGNEYFGDFSLSWATNSSSKPWWSLLSSGRLDMDVVQQDVAAIRLKYEQAGFLDVEVGRVVKFSDDKTDAWITFQIRENSRYRVNRIRIKGNTVFSTEELTKKLSLRQGDFANAEAMEVARNALTTSYGRMGYIETSTVLHKQFLSPLEPLPDWTQKLTRRGESIAVVDLMLVVREGEQFRVRRIDLRPASAHEYADTQTQTRILRRQVTLFPGQLFNTAAAKESQNRIRGTRIFGKALITPVGQDPRTRDAIVEAVETQTGSIMFGIGVSSNTGINATIAYTERNYDAAAWPGAWRDIWNQRAWKGAGQELQVSAAPGIDVSQYRINWRDPQINDQPYSLDLGGFATSAYRETHDEESSGITAGVGHRFKNAWYGQLSSRTQNVTMSNIDRDAPVEVRSLRGSTFLQGIGTSLTRDRTDSRWMPSRGDRFQMRLEHVMGDFTFDKLTSNYRVYQTLHVDALDRKHILAFKVAAGHIISDAPTFEKFYGGGHGSVRGFKYRGISPRSGPGQDPVGGDFMLSAGAEYGYPLAGEVLRGVLFLDTGTVEDSISINKYRVSAGFGLHWVVPMMGPVPVRLDFGFPLIKDEKDDTRLFSFSIGWVF